MKLVLYYKGFAVFSLHLCGIGSLALELVSLLSIPVGVFNFSLCFTIEP